MRGTDEVKAIWTEFSLFCKESFQSADIMEKMTENSFSDLCLNTLHQIKAIYQQTLDRFLENNQSKAELIRSVLVLIGDVNGVVFVAKKIITKCLKLMAPMLLSTPNETNGDKFQLVDQLAQPIQHCAAVALDELKLNQARYKPFNLGLKNKS